MQFRRTGLPVFLVMLSQMLWAGGAAASGFALLTQNGSGLGNAYAGATANTGDASTIFFNPAGMAHLHGRQIVVAGTVISGSSQFADTGSAAAGSGRALGSAPGANKKTVLLPGIYFVHEYSPQLHLGIGINAPFGSKTEYPANWIGRYQAIKSSIETTNVNPSLSWQVNDALSVGAGINYQRIKASMTNAIVVVPALPAFDGISTMEGSDAAWGYNFGGLLKLSDGARFGMSYRSGIDYRLTGTLYVESALVAPGTTNTAIPVTATFRTPDSLSAGYFQPLDDKWDLMADVSLTGWSRFNELRVVYAATGATASLTPENWHNTWRVAVGVNHHYSEQWTLRAGLAYDQDPVPEGLRTARIPDSDRTWLSLGGQYKLANGGALDFGYTHMFIKKSAINRNSGGADVSSTALYAQLAGSYDSRADIVSMQYSYGF